MLIVCRGCGRTIASRKATRRTKSQRKALAKLEGACAEFIRKAICVDCATKEIAAERAAGGGVS